MAAPLSTTHSGKTETMAERLPEINRGLGAKTGLRPAVRGAQSGVLPQAAPKKAGATTAQLRAVNSVSNVQPPASPARPRAKSSSVALPLQASAQIVEKAAASPMLMQSSGASPLGGGNQIKKTPSGRQPVQQRCSRCACGLSAMSVEIGAAQLVDGKLVCLDCIRREKRSQRLKQDQVKLPLAKIAVGTVAMLAVLGFVFPSQILFVLAAAAVLGVGVSILGFTIPGGVRLVVGTASIALACGSIWGIASLKNNSEIQLVDAQMAKDSGEIHALLNEDKFAEASARAQSLRTAARRAVATDSLRRTSDAVDHACDEWLSKNFGPLTVNDKAVITRLLSLYPFKNASGSRKFRGITLDKTAPKMVIALDCQAADPSEKVNGATLPVDSASLIEAASIGGALFQTINPQTVEVQLVNAGTDATVGTFTLTQNDVACLTSSPSIEDVMRTFKAQN